MAGRSLLIALAALAILPASAAAIQPGLDPGFGQDGIVELAETGSFSDVFKVRAGPYAGDILAVGRLGDGGYDCPCGTLLAMFDDDGSLHEQFGSEGIVEDTRLQAQAAAMDSQGRIVAAGGNQVSRYRPDGEVDATFGAGGLVTLASATPENSTVAASVLAVANDAVRVGAFDYDPRASRPSGAGILVGLTAEGSPDAGFGDGGRASLVSGGRVAVSDLAVGVGGDIVYAGSRATDRIYPEIDRHFMAGRVHSDGTMDESFPASFPAFEPPPCPSGDCGLDDQAAAAAVNESGETFAAGSAAEDWVVAKYRIGGVLDASFAGGHARTRFPGHLSARAGDIVLDGSSHALAVGTDGLQMAAVRYQADGTAAARISSAAPSGISSALEGAEVSDGSLIAAGKDRTWEGREHPLLARYSIDFPSVSLPSTRIDSHPPRHTARHRSIFTFHSSDPDATFLCWGDFDFQPRPCGSPYRTPALEYGDHLLSVRAISPDGVQDTAIKIYRFTVRPYPHARR